MDEYQFFKHLCDKQQQEINKLDSKTQNKFISSLNEKGLVVTRKGEQYKLPAYINYYDENKILKHFPSDIEHINLNIYYQLESTNNELKTLPPSTKTEIIISEYQSNGRGRRGNQWVSPLGSNIYLSIKLASSSIKNKTLFPIYVAIILSEFLSTHNIPNIKIKWPNDIYINSEKCIGLMMELVNDTDKKQALILGIGINLQHNVLNQYMIDQPITGLSEHTHSSIITDKNSLLGLLLPYLLSSIKEFNHLDPESIIKRFNHFNYLSEQNIEIKEKNKSYEGKFLKLNLDGSLVAEVGNQHNTFYSADVSIRKH